MLSYARNNPNKSGEIRRVGVLMEKLMQKLIKKYAMVAI